MLISPEILRNLKHDVVGSCQLLQSALPLFEKHNQEDSKKAFELLEEMAACAERLARKIRNRLPVEDNQNEYT